MNDFNFSKDEAWRRIEIDDLENTVVARNASGQFPRTRPVEPWVLISTLMSMFAENNIPVSVDKVVVHQNGANVIASSGEKIDKNQPYPLNRWIFNKLMFVLKTKFSDDRMYSMLAGAYTPEGITLAWGMNVRACENMCIFGNNFARTFGGTKQDRSMDYGSVLDIIKKYIYEHDGYVESDMKMIQQMMSIGIPANFTYSPMIGELYTKAYNNAYGTKGNSPFLISGISKLVDSFTSEGIATISQDGLLISGGVPKTLWDIYNAGTRIMTPDHYDMVDIIPSNSLWGNFLLNSKSMFGSATDPVIIEAKEVVNVVHEESIDPELLSESLPTISGGLPDIPEIRPKPGSFVEGRNRSQGNAPAEY